jgi:hypothetical protein
MVTEPEFESPEEEVEVSADEFPPDERDLIDDATLVMNDDTQRIQNGAPPQQGLATEEISVSFTDAVGTEGMPSLGTENVGTEGIPSLGTESFGTEAMPTNVPGEPVAPQIDTDEVFVLLPDEEIPVVETTEVDDGFGDGLATESIADAELKSVNPLNDSEDDYDEPEYVDMGEGVGVIDEIAELASDLDEDILTADEVDENDDYISEEGVYQEYEDMNEFEGRKSRAPVLVAAALLALVSLGGVYFFVVRQQGAVDGGATAIAQGGDAGVEVPGGDGDTGIEVATAGSEDPIGGADPDVGGQTEIDGSVDTGIDPSFSTTRIAVREQVQLVMKLGLQWEHGED